jgi:hypothetical protein
MDSLQTIVTKAGPPVVAGVLGGLALWYLEKEVATEIQAHPMWIPVVGGLAATGAVFLFMR